MASSAPANRIISDRKDPPNDDDVDRVFLPFFLVCSTSYRLIVQQHFITTKGQSVTRSSSLRRRLGVVFLQQHLAHCCLKQYWSINQYVGYMAQGIQERIGQQVMAALLCSALLCCVLSRTNQHDRAPLPVVPLPLWWIVAIFETNGRRLIRNDIEILLPYRVARRHWLPSQLTHVFSFLFSSPLDRSTCRE